MSRSSTAMKQEGFFIAEENLAKRKKIVRQDRVQLETGKCILEFHALKVEVINISTFGCAAVVTPEGSAYLRDLYTQSEHHTAKVFYEGTETQTLQLRKVREVPHPTSVCNEVVWAFETLGEPFKVDRIKVLEVTTNILRNQNDYSVKLERLPVEYRQIVFQMRDWFHKLKESIDQLEREAPVDNAQEAQEYRMTLVENIGEYIGKVVPQVYSKVPPMLKNLSPEDTQLATEFIREQLGPYIYGAPFASRAYHKPRGYAGDYEMMNHLYRAELTGRTLFDQCVHKYFVDEPAGAAVKNRGYYLVEKITQLFREHNSRDSLKIVSVASGPAVEQQLFLQSGKEFYNRPAVFTCLDQDEESLKHAQRQLMSTERFVKSGFQFNFKNLAIRNVIAGGLPEKDYDLIYSAGLFDYLTEPVAQMAAQKMMASLKPGGKLIIGNFSTDNPCVPFMELCLDWNLIYRSKEDLERIFKGFGSKVYVEKEPLGVNLFVVIEK
ncbi:class I SAM-dependent methyltransferase [Bdellovibrio sp. HCB337]|uniref:class I SAM-dependent methyltransferase n=1 Tax=Bdellovibrio sp. HCB337 TaxID=3394358 RepID=UPI0039A77772